VWVLWGRSCMFLAGQRRCPLALEGLIKERVQGGNRLVLSAPGVDFALGLEFAGLV